jgi:uracil-DNA glycosylase family 4
MLMDNQTIFFNKLLEEAKEAFGKSKLRFHQDRKNLNWGLSICATPILREKGVIMGINWGGGSKADDAIYKTQSVMPTKNDFLDHYEKGHYRFIDKSKKLIEEFLKIDVDSIEFNYTNLCLFRSPETSDLGYEDIQLCLPIVKEFVEFINPPWILSVGNSNVIHLGDNINYLNKIHTEGTAHNGYTGNLWGHQFYSVPHPNARKLTGDIRHAIWKNVFSG